MNRKKSDNIFSPAFVSNVCIALCILTIKECYRILELESGSQFYDKSNLSFNFNVILRDKDPDGAQSRKPEQKIKAHALRKVCHWLLL